MLGYPVIFQTAVSAITSHIFLFYFPFKADYLRESISTQNRELKLLMDKPRVLLFPAS